MCKAYYIMAMPFLPTKCRIYFYYIQLAIKWNNSLTRG